MAACVEVWKKSDCISHNLSLVLLQQQQSASKQTAVEAAFLSLLMLRPLCTTKEMAIGIARDGFERLAVINTP